MTDVALGGSVNFSDNTWGANLVSWEWTFEGGEPATSNVQNPTGITYNAIGHYDVTLTVTNADGQTETITKHNFIHVSEMYNMQNGTITTCNALFYDDGGPNGNYHDRKEYTMTFMPATTGGILEAIFEEFTLESNYDFLYIYDGTSTSAPSLGTFTGNNGPGTVTATNDEGALTFRFSSDYGVNEPGWKATVHCVGTYAPIELEISADPEAVEEGEPCQLNVVATGGTGVYTYLWEPADAINEGTIDDPTSANPIVRPMGTPESTYKVTVTDSEGNTASDDITIQVSPVSVHENDFASHIYPNPNNGIFTINVTGEFNYQLFNGLGQVILSGVGNDNTLVNAQGLPQGIYFLRLDCESGSMIEKLIIE